MASVITSVASVVSVFFYKVIIYFLKPADGCYPPVAQKSVFYRPYSAKMAYPYFYISSLDSTQKQCILDEATSKHVVQVLRMTAGERLNLTDGRGHIAEAVIKEAHKKHCLVDLQKINFFEAPVRKVTIAISLIKNPSRFEWFLEKATEIGVTQIIPLFCERTEKEKFRLDRMQTLCVSAMLQSQQCWLPLLNEPASFKQLIELTQDSQKFIAHCENTGEKLHLSSVKSPHPSVILIGPEGDFTPAEIRLAMDHQYIAVSLGETRLRTETAGVVAAVLLCTE